MFACTFVFPIRKGAMAAAEEAVWELSAAWWRSGQMIGSPFISARGASIVFRMVVPERASISPASGTDRTRAAWTAFRKLLRFRPRPTFDRLLVAPPVCRCGKPRRSFFSPEPHGPSSPLWCARCRGNVPLHRFGIQDSDTIAGLLAAEEEWEGLYWMWIHSGATEKVGLRQISDPDGEWFRDARGAVADFERAAGVEVYMEVFNAYSSRGNPEGRLCPSCGRRWSRIRAFFGLACHRCRLVALAPWYDSPPPRGWRSPQQRRQGKRRGS